MENYKRNIMKKRVLQANLNNQGGAFSVAYEAQKELQEEYVFDYFFPDKFIKNEIYEHLISMGSRCIGEIKSKNRLLKQYIVYKEFYKCLCKNNYDIVHIHSDTAWKISVYYLAAKKANTKRIVVHSHSSGINGHYRCLNYILHILAKPIIKNAKYKCACSDVAAQWMFDNTEKVTIIRNGVDIEKYKFNTVSRTQIRKKMKIDDKIVIGSVSDFSYQKNPEFIFQLIKEFYNNDKYLFLFVGNRPERCKLKKLVEKEKKIKNVIFAGAVTNVQDYLSAMDIFILPSRFEGLPMCALEAQVNGVYTIISDKVSEETKCSQHFSRLKLCVSAWKNEIENIDLKYDRNIMSDYVKEKASSSNMANEFKRIYTEE